MLAFPDDGNRYELVDGELLVTPSPAQAHQLVLGRLFTSLAAYLAPHHAVAQAFFAPGDIIWSREEYVQPDLFVGRPARSPATGVTAARCGGA